MSQPAPAVAHLSDEAALVRLVVTGIIAFCERVKLLPEGPVPPALADLIVGTSYGVVDEFYDTLETVTPVEEG